MPYAKTKEGSLVNEVTLGDGYPLSNDKQPLKVGGEASIINVSSPTPDNSVDGEVEVKGKLKAKDTVIQGDLKVFSDSDTNPQFRFYSKQGVNCQVDIQSAANTRASLKLANNQGYFELRRDSSTTSLKFTDGTNTPLTLDGDNVEFTNLTDGSITIDSFVDEDNMSSNSATKIPTQQSVKAYVDNEVAGLVDSAPAALDTLNELAAALNDDASFATTITNSLATKVGLTGDETVAGHKKFSDDLLIAGTAADPGTTDHVSLGVSSGALRIQTDSGYTQIGPTNTGWAHFYTDRDRFYFSKPVVVDGEYIASYDEDLVLRRDYNDTSYNQITIGDDTLDIKLDNTSRLAIDSNGKVDLSGNLMLRGESGIFVEDSDTTKGGSIIQPAGGMYRTSSNTHTGAIKIAFPTGTGQIADMVSFWVDVFDYGTNQAFTAYIAGYIYQDEGSNEWHNVSAQIFGNLEQNNYTVRFGHDTSNHCVLIGETTTSWDYMQVTVRNVQVGYTSDIDDYLGNFAITFETSLPTIDETLSDNLTLAKGLKSSGSIAVATGTSSGNDFAINTDTLVVEGDNNRVGIGTTSPITPLHIESTNNALADNDEPENCHLLLRNAANDTNEGVGLGFLISTATNDVGASIIYKRTGASAKGELHFNVKDNSTSNGVITQAMTIDDSANVGIGTTSPSVELEVNGDIKANELTLDGSSAGIRITNDGGTEIYLEQGTGHAANISSNNAMYLLAGASQKLHFGANNANSQMVLDAGKVGIGTTSPSVLTHISADGSSTLPTFNASTRLAVTQTGNTGGYNAITVLGGHATGASMYKFGDKDNDQIGYFSYLHEHNRLDTYVNGSHAMSIDSSGNVGIGTTSPTTTLDVEGTVSYKHTAFSTLGPTDNVDVSDTTVLEVDTSSNNVTIGGFTGGVQGQIIYIVKIDTAGRLKLEHNETPASGTSQKIYVTSGADETILGYGGWTLYCNGTNWYSLSNPTGTADGG